MNTGDNMSNFLHNHPMWETSIGLDSNHVIVDKGDWIKARELWAKSQEAEKSTSSGVGETVQTREFLQDLCNQEFSIQSWAPDGIARDWLSRNYTVWAKGKPPHRTTSLEWLVDTLIKWENGNSYQTLESILEDRFKFEKAI